jgi:uncharacterized DUF497 family protein
VALAFEWDERKNTANRKKHGLSFDEAKTVFSDEEALLKEDPDHSEDEDRSKDEVIRIISARKATRSERAEYERSLSR